MEDNMKILHPHNDQLSWILDDLFRFWKRDNWPMNISDKKLRILYFKEGKENELLIIDFDQPSEIVIIQIHYLLEYLNFPVELEKVYWQFINS